MYKEVLTLIVTISLLSCSNGQKSVEKTNLSELEFSEKMTLLKDEQLIDVRTPEEFSGGHLENATNIDWNGNSFKEQVAKLDKSKPVMIYCLSGGRSSAAAAEMRKNGFKEVYEMNGGMMAWRSKNLPETKSNHPTSSMTKAQYDALLVSDKLVLIDFYAEWCAPCKKMELFLNKLTEELKDKVVIIRIDADKNSDLCRELNVTALPVLKLYENKELVWDNLGFADEGKVREQLNRK
jgi:thioredoxin 1